MAEKSPHELRNAPKAYRNMCADGLDPRLKASLELPADEFELEAERLEASQSGVSDHKSADLMIFN